MHMIYSLDFDQEKRFPQGGLCWFVEWTAIMGTRPGPAQSPRRLHPNMFHFFPLVHHRKGGRAAGQSAAVLHTDSISVGSYQPSAGWRGPSFGQRTPISFPSCIAQPTRTFCDSFARMLRYNSKITCVHAIDMSGWEIVLFMYCSSS